MSDDHLPVYRERKLWRNCPLSLVSLMLGTLVNSPAVEDSVNSPLVVRKLYRRSDLRRFGFCSNLIKKS